MRTLLVSPFDNRPGFGMAAHMIKEVSRKLAVLGEVTQVSVAETRWRQNIDPAEIEQLAYCDQARKTWQEKISARYHSSKSAATIFNFLGFDEGMALDTLAVFYLAGASWQNTAILADVPGRNSYFFTLRDLIAGRKNPPPIFHSAEQYVEWHKELKTKAA